MDKAMESAWEAVWSSGTPIQTILLLCTVCAIGVYLGKAKIKGFTLGVTWVFFVGILFAHFGARANADMLRVIQDFGLILFIYALGVQVGPGFVTSFRQHGVWLNLWGLVLIAGGFAILFILLETTGLDLSGLIGTLSGAVTNTPAMAAAQQAATTALSDPAEVLRSTSDMAIATAITYPMGVVGVILVLALLKRLFPTKTRQHSTLVDHESQHTAREYVVSNPALDGQKMSSLQEILGGHFVVSRIFRDGEYITPTNDTLLHRGDHLRVASERGDVERLTYLFGTVEDRDEELKWDNDHDPLVMQRLLVTKESCNGMKLSQLRIRSRFDVNITRVTRNGMELVARPNLRLHMGDRLSAVGREKDIKELAAVVGNELKPLDTPYVVSIFLGIALGCLLGMIPLYLPGLAAPLRLGLAGGPIIVGILMGAYGPHFKMNTYITTSANLMLRNLGLALFLGGLGLSSGQHFWEMLVDGPGLEWFAWGTVMTIVPTLIVGIVVLKWTNMSYNVASGMLTGAMANPMALSLVSGGEDDDDDPTISYATVYPLAMFARVILSQLVVGLFPGLL